MTSPTGILMKKFVLTHMTLEEAYIHGRLCNGVDLTREPPLYKIYTYKGNLEEISDEMCFTFGAYGDDPVEAYKSHVQPGDI